MSLTTVVPGKTRIGWIGTGVMGSSMCGHLLDAGFSATVYNRSKAKAEKLLACGARWAESPRAVAENADVIFTIVGYPADVRSVILGPDGVLAGCRPGSIIVDMTTSQPSLAVEIAAAAAAIGVQSLDAPVSGGDVGAREARLSIMVGGEKAAFEAVLPCFQAMGKTIVRQGGPGAGQHTQNGQPDHHRLDDGRHLRGAALRLPGRARPEHRTAIHRLGGGPAVGRSRTSARGSSRTDSSRVSSSSTSSRTWASRWTRPSG